MTTAYIFAILPPDESDIEKEKSSDVVNVTVISGVVTGILVLCVLIIVTLVLVITIRHLKQKELKEYNVSYSKSFGKSTTIENINFT